MSPCLGGEAPAAPHSAAAARLQSAALKGPRCRFQLHCDLWLWPCWLLLPGGVHGRFHSEPSLSQSCPMSTLPPVSSSPWGWRTEMGSKSHSCTGLSRSLPAPLVWALPTNVCRTEGRLSEAAGEERTAGGSPQSCPRGSPTLGSLVLDSQGWGELGRSVQEPSSVPDLSS